MGLKSSQEGNDFHRHNIFLCGGFRGNSLLTTGLRWCYTSMHQYIDAVQEGLHYMHR